MCVPSPWSYAGELSKEEDVLEWLVENKSTGDEEDVIEDVTAKTLSTLIGNIDNLVVLFCEYIPNQRKRRKKCSAEYIYVAFGVVVVFG